MLTKIRDDTKFPISFCIFLIISFDTLNCSVEDHGHPLFSKCLTNNLEFVGQNANFNTLIGCGDV